MKRKAAISAESLMSENANPGRSNNSQGNGSQNKKRRVRPQTSSSILADDSCMESAASKRRRLKAATVSIKKTVTQEVIDDNSNSQAEQKEILEDMGLNILSDNSNSCDTNMLQNSSNKSISAAKVLQDKNTNISTNAPIAKSPQLSALKRPEPPSNAPRLNNIQIDAGSSSFLTSEDTENINTSIGDTSISEDFFRYSYTLAHPDKKKEAVKPGRDYFNRMPTEIVLSVFKWLPKCSLSKCARVCKRWNKLVEDETLWRRQDLGLPTVAPGVIGQVLSRGCAVLRLAKTNISPPIFVSSVTGMDTFPRPGLQSSRLQYLDLSMSSISVSCLEQLLSHCTMIRNLALEICQVSDICCSSIAANVNLSVLHMGGVQGLTQLGVARILKNCPKLVELNLGWTNLSEEALNTVCVMLKSPLRRLCLTGNRDSLQDSHVANILENCPNLRELDISDSSKLTSACLSMIVEKLLYIESLSFSRCYGITPSSYLMLASSPTLLYLNVFGLLRENALAELTDRLQGIEINNFMFTSVARPTVGVKRTSIWNLRTRD